MNFHAVNYSGLKVAPKFMSLNIPLNYCSEDVKKKLCPVLIHLPCVFADRTWEISHLFDAINKSGLFKNCVPKLPDWLVHLPE